MARYTFRNALEALEEAKELLDSGAIICPLDEVDARQRLLNMCEAIAYEHEEEIEEDEELEGAW